LAGLEKPSSGSIRFDDREVSSMEPRERDIAMVFQSYALYPHLSVRENLAFGLKLKKTSSADIDKRVGEVSHMLGLGKLLGRKPSELSGGQRQRVAMGRAIVRRPSLFLFDEPLSNLDAALRAQVRVDIKKLHAELGTTSVYVTHDQVEAMTLADKMFVLNGGRIEQAGAPLEVYDTPATRFVASFLGSPAMNFLDGRVMQGDDGWSVCLPNDGADVELPIERERYRGLDKGRAVVIGVRPHDWTRRDDGIEISVVLTEALGGETYAHSSIAGQTVIVRLDGSERVAAGDKLHLLPARLHLFDERSGESLSC
jgi:sn-glycerol 3-phosphate transport system ATP-binding protein/multiple sugar transport system ATP-binding protein